jgi:hypothetical protein
VARARYQSYLLCEPANRYSKPSMAWVSHVGGDYTAGDFSLMRVSPRDTPRTDIGTELDEALPSEVIEIELQSILKANSVSRARHLLYPAILIGAILPDMRYKKCNNRLGGGRR